MKVNIIFAEINDGLSMIINILTILGMGGIAGLYKEEKKRIDEHRSEALFGYYARMKILLTSIQRSLGLENNTPLLNGLSADVLNNKYPSYKIDETLFSELKPKVEELLNFFKSESWQIPLNKDFPDTIQSLIDNMYFILDIYSYKKFNNLQEVEGALNRITKNIESVIKTITDEQGELINPEKKKGLKNLFGKKHKENGSDDSH